MKNPGGQSSPCSRAGMRAATPLWSEQIRILSLTTSRTFHLNNAQLSASSIITLTLLVYFLHVIFYSPEGASLSRLVQFQTASIAPQLICLCAMATHNKLVEQHSARLLPGEEHVTPSRALGLASLLNTGQESSTHRH